MSSPQSGSIPAELETLEQVEEWAHASGLDFYDVLWEWDVADLYALAHASGITAAELTTRMLAARGLEPDPVP